MQLKKILFLIGSLIGGMIISGSLVYAIALLPTQQGGTGLGGLNYPKAGAVLFGNTNVTLATSTNLIFSTSTNTLTTDNLTLTGSCNGCGIGGSGGGTFSTTTSNVANELINHPNNNSDILTIGSNSTTTAKYYFDPNAQIFNIAAGSVPTYSAAGNIYATQPSNKLDQTLYYSDNAYYADNINNAITTSRDYYICSGANGASCSWNGFSTTTVTTIADTNDCETVNTPCRTIAGVEAKIHGKSVLDNAIVTIHLADNTNSGSDCYLPNNLVFSNPTPGASILFQGGRLDNFPTSYIYIVGNTSSSTAVTLAQNACNSPTFGGTNATPIGAIIANKTSVRVNGVQAEGYGSEGTGGEQAIFSATGGGTMFVENAKGIGNVQNQASLKTSIAGAYGTGSSVATGLNITSIHGSAILGASDGGTGYTFDPADTATNMTNWNYTCASGESCRTAQTALGHSVIFEDRLNYTASGPGSFTWQLATLDSEIEESEVYGQGGATDCNGPSGAGKCVNGTFSAGMTAANYEYEIASGGSYIDADCDNSTGFTCSVSVEPTIKATVSQNSTIHDYATGGSVTPGFVNPKYTIKGGKMTIFNGAGVNNDYLTSDFEQIDLDYASGSLGDFIQTSAVSGTSSWSGYSLPTTNPISSGQVLMASTTAGAVWGNLVSENGNLTIATTTTGEVDFTVNGTGLTAYDAWTHPYAASSATTSTLYLNGFASEASSSVAGLLTLTNASSSEISTSAAGGFYGANYNSLAGGGITFNSANNTQFNSVNSTVFTSQSNNLYYDGSQLYPQTSNSLNLGISNHLWNTIYSTTATTTFDNVGTLTLSTTTAGCLQANSVGTVFIANCSGGGSGGGTWATTTSNVAGELVNYSLNNTDIVDVGGNATTSAKMFFDPNKNLSYFNGSVGIGTSSPFTSLGVTGTITANNINATSSTATNYFGNPNSLFNGVPPIAGLGTSNSQVVIPTNINNLARGLDIANTNTGAQSEDGITFENSNSTNLGASSAYIGGLVFGGANFNTAGFTGLAPNGIALFSTDGGVAQGSISSNPASSTLTWYAGNNGGFGGGMPDMTLRVPTSWAAPTVPLASSGGNPYLGLGTTSPQWVDTIYSSTTPQLALGDTSNNNVVTLRAAGGNLYIGTANSSTYATSTPAVVVANNNAVGIGTTSPSASLAITPQAGQDSLNISSSTQSLFKVTQAGAFQLYASQPGTSTTITLDWANSPQQVEYQIGNPAVSISVINATTTNQWGSSKRIYVYNPPNLAGGALTWKNVFWFGTPPVQTTTAGGGDEYICNVTAGTSTPAAQVLKVECGANLNAQ